MENQTMFVKLKEAAEAVNSKDAVPAENDPVARAIARMVTYTPGQWLDFYEWHRKRTETS